MSFRCVAAILLCVVVANGAKLSPLKDEMERFIHSWAVNSPVQTDSNDGEGSGGNVIEAFSCALRQPGLYSDPQDCHSYYECVAGFDTPFHRACAMGWSDGPHPVFDQAAQRCDWPMNVAGPCGTKDSRCADKAPGNYPVPGSCTQYYKCFPGLVQGLDGECPDGTVFHPEMMACNWPWAVPPPCGTQ
ncbi:hypothetical protein Bbelb_341110 [Branchiostoma belcheri]|nr:hypothetical protein Bbelb_341110 [Branchiostoma belcheri]